MSKTVCVPFEEELKKNPELRESDIQSLRNWTAKQPHLPKISDSELALFLHSNNYLIEPAKTMIDTFYTIRTHTPELFSNRDPVDSKELRNIFKLICIMPLKERTKDGYAVTIAKIIDADPTNYVYNDHLKMLFMCLDLWMYKIGTTNGHVLLFDAAGVTLGHATKLNPATIKKFLLYLQEALPVRLKGIHFLNTSPILDVILNMMRPFMKKKLLDIMYLHPTLETVEKFMCTDYLPNELGGKAGPIIDFHDEQIKYLENHRDWFLEEELNARIDENKRSVKEKSSSDLFGVEGSFKKLNID